MSDQSSNSPKRKSAKKRAVQREQGQAKVAAGAKNTRSNPVVADETYGDLRQDNRVVMRHSIALNIDNFKPASDDFVPPRCAFAET